MLLVAPKHFLYNKLSRHNIAFERAIQIQIDMTVVWGIHVF